jgi:hypothetical protein
MNLGLHLCVILLAIFFGMVGATIVAVISVSFELLAEWLSKQLNKKRGR